MNWKEYKYSWVLILFILTSSVNAQQLLTLDEALKLALENNYSIQVAKNDAALAANNNRLGAAGMLPTVVGTAGQDNQVVDSKQKFLNGTENNRTGAKNSSMNANVELGWTIFDGLKMFATKNRLEELQKVGELRMRQNIEVTFVRVIRAYYDVMLAKQQSVASKELADNSKNRLMLADEKYKAGKSAKTEWLKAQVDLNTDMSALMRVENSLKNAKVNLNQLLARELQTNFEVPDSVNKFVDYKLDDLTNKTLTQNAGLLMAKKNLQISKLGLNEVRAERMPTIQLKSGYNYSSQQSQAGFLQSSQTNGFHYGAGLSINLFNGMDVNKRLQNANLAIRTNDLVYKDSVSKIQNVITQAYNSYVMSKQLIEFEKTNVAIARQNYEISNEQYKQGVITSLELRDAQQNLLNSELRLFNAQYETKLNETELLRLSGDLVKL